MSSPSNSRQVRRPSLLSQDEPYSPLPTRSGTLASLIRNRSTQSFQSLNGSYSHAHPHAQFSFWGSDDEEAGNGRPSRPQDNEELNKLLKDERRLSQLLNGVPHLRSLKLIGRSNPRYRWERYWKQEEELKAMSKPM